MQATMLTVYFCFVFTLGVFLNGLVIITYMRYRKTMLCHAKDVVILSLGVGDLLSVILACPLTLSSSVAHKWLWGRAGCVWYGFVTTCTSLASITELSLLAYQRYKTLQSPTPNTVSTKSAFQAVLCSWILAGLSSSFPLMGWSEYTFEAFGLHCSINWESMSYGNLSYSVYLLIVFYFVPIAIIVFSYIKFFLIVRRIYADAKKRWGPEAEATKEVYQAQVTTAKQLFITISGFLFVWTPYAVVSTLVLVFGADIPYSVREYPSIFAKLSVVCNPVLFFITYRKLREKSFTILKCAVGSLGCCTRQNALFAPSEYEVQKEEAV